MNVNGIDREYEVRIPDGYDQNTPYPVVFGFHGRGREGGFQSTSYGNLQSTMGDSAILVFPNGEVIVNQQADGELIGGSAESWETEGDADIAFFDAMLTDVTEGLCVNEERVFATGFSMGGYFSARLGCERGDVLRAFAAAGGGPPEQGINSCLGSSGAWVAHDPEDEFVDYQTGGIALREYWKSANMCSDASVVVGTNGCVEYTCSGETTRWCEYSEAGGNGRHHTWPSFGPVEVWAFFQGFE